MKIGELAKSAQCTAESIRYYEKEKLLPKPDRAGNNYRLYGPSHLERLLFIRNCRALDMSQEEVRILLRALDKPASRCDEVNILLDEHISHVQVRIKELQCLKEQLTVLRRKCRSRNRVEECGILKRLSTMRSHPKRTLVTHLG